MPEPGQTPQPEFKQGKGPEALPWGEAAQVNDAVGLIPPEEQDFQPRNDAESFLTSPTDRPAEPFSHGAPFGAGSDIAAPNTEEDFRDMTTRALAASPNQSPEVKAFLAKMAQGL